MILDYAKLGTKPSGYNRRHSSLELPPLKLDGLDGDALEIYFKDVTARITTPHEINGLTLDVLNWSQKDEEKPVVLILPIELKNERISSILIIPFDLYYVGYQRRDGVFRIFKKHEYKIRDENQVTKVIQHLKRDGVVKNVEMGTSYRDLEEVAQKTRQEIRLGRTELMEAVHYLADDGDTFDHRDILGPPLPEGGSHHLFITQFISEAIRGKLLLKFLIENFEIGKQIPPSLIIPSLLYQSIVGQQDQIGCCDPLIHFQISKCFFVVH